MKEDNVKMNFKKQSGRKWFKKLFMGTTVNRLPGSIEGGEFHE
jgi:hypothetical protein